MFNNKKKNKNNKHGQKPKHLQPKTSKVYIDTKYNIYSKELKMSVMERFIFKYISLPEKARMDIISCKVMNHHIYSV